MFLPFKHIVIVIIILGIILVIISESREDNRMVSCPDIHAYPWNHLIHPVRDGQPSQEADKGR